MGQTKQYITVNNANNKLYANSDTTSDGDNYTRFRVSTQSLQSYNEPVLQYNVVCLENMQTTRTMFASGATVDASTTGCSSMNNLFWLNGINYDDIRYRDQLVEASNFPTPIVNVG